MHLLIFVTLCIGAAVSARLRTGVYDHVSFVLVFTEAQRPKTGGFGGKKKVAKFFASSFDFFLYLS